MFRFQPNIILINPAVSFNISFQERREQKLLTIQFEWNNSPCQLLDICLNKNSIIWGLISRYETSSCMLSNVIQDDKKQLLGNQKQFCYLFFLDQKS